MTQYIPWIISAVSLLLAYVTFLRNGTKDHDAAAEKDAAKLDGLKESLLKANMKLDQVCSVTTETRTDIKSMNKDISELDRRITIVERDVKTAFSLIDEVKTGDDGK